MASRGLNRLDVWLSQSENVPPGILNAAPNSDTIIPPAGNADEDRTSTTGYWIVFNAATGSDLDNLALLPARTSQDAQLAYRQWYQRTGYMLGRDSIFYVRPGDEIDVSDAWRRGLPMPPPMTTGPQTLAPSSSDDAGRWQRTEWNIVDNDTGQVLHTFSGPGVTQGVANTMAAAWLEAEGPEDADMTEISVVPVPRSTIQDIPMDIAQNFQEPPASWDSGSPVVSEPQNFPQPQSFPQLAGEFSGEWKVVDGLNREVHRFGGIGNSQSDANRVAREWAQRTGFDGNLEVYPVMR
jgi:hypothetical protein